MKPRFPLYPIYIPSKGRADAQLTAAALDRDGVPFRVVVEPPEYEAYRRELGEDYVLELPFENLGLGSIPARNWIWEHALESGAARHWVLDDNLVEFRRLYRGRRIPADAGVALRTVEDFADRYENVAIAGLNYQMFVLAETKVPFYLNVHVYSCMLLSTGLPNRWRGRYNEDTDLCLQVLAEGWCTVLVNAFMANKLRTGAKGGNTDELYAGDGRLRMARALERAWPGVVSVARRYGRPQHVVDWTKFDHALRRRDDFDFEALDETDEYGLRLRAMKEVESSALRDLANDERSS